MVGLSANPIHSVLFLILSFLASSISIIINNGNVFIGIIIIIVYIGAVSILFLFSVLLLDLRSTALYTTRKYIMLTFFTTIIILFSEIGYLLNDTSDYILLQDSTKIYYDWNSLFHSFHETEVFGLLLYNDYFYGVILIALTLFLALIGAIIISLSGSSRLRRQIVNQQLSRSSSTFLRSNIKSTV
jgi:NADH-quinone oxidoreductase subunit J